MPLKLTDVADKQDSTLPVIPSGYIPIKLSSNGLFGVPNPVHVRNFRTEELVNLSITEDTEIPELLTSILQGMIHERTDVRDWPDRCVIELIVRLYANYYSPILQSVPFPVEPEDIQYAEEHDLQDILFKIKSQTLSIPLDIRTISILPADPSLKKYVTITAKDTGVSVKLVAYPRFGDVIQVQKYIKDKFRQEEKFYARVQQALQIQSDQPIPDDIYDMLDAYFDFVRRKTTETLKATKVLYIVEVDGVDYSTKTLQEKIDIYDSDPRLLDVNMSKVIDKEYKKFRFGIQPELTVQNPVTGALCTRRFSFRLVDILQAIKTHEPDGYDISYDD